MRSCDSPSSTLYRTGGALEKKATNLYIVPTVGGTVDGESEISVN